ncbi:MAG: J domain-containing protein [Oligoflexia bacterium]|nr:J domain-containing protein [Oligoflexia bacterium]
MDENRGNGFYLAQIALGAIFLGAMLWLRNREKPSGFRTEEGRSPEPRARRGAQDPLAQARLKKKEPLLALPGVVLEGKAHEILGIREDATELEIRRAWKELMKRHHPDKSASAKDPSATEWKDAQKISEALNRAKDEMLARRKGR